MSTHSAEARPGMGGWILVGTIAGLLGGVVFIFFEMLVAKSTGSGALSPLRLISAIIFGQNALPPAPAVGKVTVIATSFALHFVLSAVYGGVFGAFTGLVGVLRDNRWVLLAAALFFGLALWLVNFYVLANLFFPWFTNANPLVQFFAHVLFYGGALWLLVEGSKSKEEGER